MEAAIQYFIRSGIVMLILYIYYILFLSKDTCFKCNRLYLIFTLLFSAVIPLLPELFKSGLPVAGYFAKMDTIVVLPGNISDTSVPASSTVNPLYMNLLIIYSLGAIISLTRLIIQTFVILRMANRYGIRRENGVNVVYTGKATADFSFFNLIFLSKEGSRKDKAVSIINHEKAHIKQKHFLDLLLIELMSVIFWFNPVIYLLKRSMISVHEFLADEEVLNAGTEKEKYQKLLLSQTFGIPVYSFVNNFNQSLIKRRFIMMSKSKSKLRTAIKIAFALPLIFSVALMFSGKKTVQAERIPVEKAFISQYQPPDSSGIDTARTVFTLVDKMPVYPGGDEARMKFLKENLKYPAQAQKKGIQGRVYISFIVEKDGSITNVKILRGIGGGCDEEAIRVIKKMPKWIPGEDKGRKVRVQFNMPIVFKLARETKTESKEKKQ